MNINSRGYYTGMQFLNENTGYVCGHYTGLYKTYDGGQSFTSLSNSPSDIKAFHFVNENEGLVFGDRKYSNGDCHVWGSFIHMTSDGGLTWQGDNRLDGIIKICSPVHGTYYGIGNGILHLNKIFRIDIK